MCTDHMHEAHHRNGEWTNVEIKPYQSLLLEPSVSALHYGQAIFEGMKAYKNQQGNAFIFRPRENFHRFNLSAARMNMPEIPQETFTAGLRQFIDVDKECI